jgi:Lambda phage tail tube protein, TTP
MPVSGFGVIALPAINTLLQVGQGNSPETFNTIANVSSITGPSLAGNVVDVTSMSTGVPWRQKIVTLLEGGEVSFDIFWIPELQSGGGIEGHVNLLTLFVNRGQSGVAGTPIDFRMVFPDQDASTYTFQGFVSKLSLTEKVDDVVRAACTITITGQVGFPYGTP